MDIDRHKGKQPQQTDLNGCHQNKEQISGDHDKSTCTASPQIGPSDKESSGTTGFPRKAREPSPVDSPRGLLKHVGNSGKNRKSPSRAFQHNSDQPASKEIYLVKGSTPYAQNYRGDCEIGQVTRSQGTESQCSGSSQVLAPQYRQVSAAEPIGGMGQQPRTLQQCGSAASRGASFIEPQGSLSSRVDDLGSMVSVITESPAISGFRLNASDVAKATNSAETGGPLTETATLREPWPPGVDFGSWIDHVQLQLRERHGQNSERTFNVPLLSERNPSSGPATPRDFSQAVRLSLRALAHEEHELDVSGEQSVNESSQHSGSPASGVRGSSVSRSEEVVAVENFQTNGPIASTRGYRLTSSDVAKALASAEIQRIIRETPTLKPSSSVESLSDEVDSDENVQTDRPIASTSGYHLTASDVAKALASDEIQRIIREIPVTLKPSSSVQSRSHSWLMATLIKRHQDAGPLQVWVIGPGLTQNTEGERNRNTEGDRNEGMSLDEALAYIENTDPPEFVIAMLREKGYPVPGDPGWDSWLKEFRESRRITLPLTPENFNLSDLALHALDFQNESHDQFVYSELPTLDLPSIDDWDIWDDEHPELNLNPQNTQNPPIVMISNTHDPNFDESREKSPKSPQIDSTNPKSDKTGEKTTNSSPIPDKGQDSADVDDYEFVTISELLNLNSPEVHELLDRQDNVDMYNSEERNGLAYLDPSNAGANDVAPRHVFYEENILNWTRYLIALRKRPRWWDQPERGERLIGVMQELQKDSVQSFAGLHAAAAARQPNTELAQRLEQDTERVAEFLNATFIPDVASDLDLIRQWLKRLDDIRREPPYFQESDAESYNRFVDIIATFYSVLIETIERIYGAGVGRVMIDELVQIRNQVQRQHLELAVVNNTANIATVAATGKYRESIPGFRNAPDRRRRQRSETAETNRGGTKRTRAAGGGDQRTPPAAARDVGQTTPAAAGDESQTTLPAAARDVNQTTPPAATTHGNQTTPPPAGIDSHVNQSPIPRPSPETIGADKITSATITEWLKGLFVMRGKALRLAAEPVTRTGTSNLLFSPPLRTFYLALLTSGEMTFNASVSDVSNEQCESKRKGYAESFIQDPAVMELVQKQWSNDIYDLLVDDGITLNIWTAQYYNVRRDLRAWITDNPEAKLLRSTLLRALLEEIRETGSALLGDQRAQETFKVESAELAEARDVLRRQADRQHETLTRQREQQEKASLEGERLQEERENVGGEQQQPAAPGDDQQTVQRAAGRRRLPRAAEGPRPPGLANKRIVTTEEEAPRAAEMQAAKRARANPPAPPPDPGLVVAEDPVTALLQPPYVEDLQIDTVQARKKAAKSIVISRESGWSARGLSVPRNFTPEEYANLADYIQLTYIELKRLMLEMALAILGREKYNNMGDMLRDDLEFLVVAYYRFAAGQVDHCEPSCPRTFPPLECCYTQTFGNLFAEPDREKRHKLLMDKFVKAVLQRFIVYCEMTGQSLRRLPDVTCKYLMDWIAQFGFKPTASEYKTISQDTQLNVKALMRWFKTQRLANELAVEAANTSPPASAPVEAAPPAGGVPVDTAYLFLDTRARKIIIHWMEQHRDYPFTTKQERIKLSEMTGLPMSTIETFTKKYRNNNRHRLNAEFDLIFHNELSLKGSGEGYPPRYRLVGAPIEDPTVEEGDGSEEQANVPAAGNPRVEEGEGSEEQANVPAAGAVRDDALDTEEGAEVLPGNEEQGGEELEVEDEGANLALELENIEDILNEDVDEGIISWDEAMAILNDATDGDGLQEEADANRAEVLDHEGMRLLPRLEGPEGVDLRRRQLYMVGGRSKCPRWRPSAEVEKKVFALKQRALEQIENNSNQKWLQRTWERYHADISRLIEAHENFANGNRVHCRTTCNLEEDPGPCCFNERFGHIDHIQGKKERMTASLPIFDVDIARLNFTAINDSEQKVNAWQWVLPFSAAVELERWLFPQLKTQKFWKPTDQDYEKWEKVLGVPKTQARHFIAGWRKYCWTLGKAKRDYLGPGLERGLPDAAVNYVRNWFEANLENPYLSEEQGRPICEATDLPWKKVKALLANIRRNNRHRVTETYMNQETNSRRQRFRPRQPGDEMIERQNKIRL